MTSGVSLRSEATHRRSGEQPPSGSSIMIEAVTPNHAELLAELFERNRVPAVTSGFDPFELTGQEARRIALGTHKDEYYVAARAGSLVGFSMLRGFEAGYEIPSFGVFVDHDAQGEGVGGALTAWTVAAARRLGCRSVRLSVYASNSIAHRLYISLGFVEQERSIVDRVAGQEQKIVMRLSLDASDE
jgi:ribosomal-protein-alanine N-acetyltransferase